MRTVCIVEINKIYYIFYHQPFICNDVVLVSND